MKRSINDTISEVYTKVRKLENAYKKISKRDPVNLVIDKCIKEINNLGKSNTNDDISYYAALDECKDILKKHKV